ncbi:MAG: PQQ-binding-like beta-propeller repeat protein [Deltaproteobacteria bacterium]|nr:PQQ-binding-like beta-propeller repeat protein [Deltaproteobacteria bacterium]
MRLTTVRCPSCGASLRPQRGVDTMPCGYCGSVVLLHAPHNEQERALPRAEVQPAPLVIVAAAAVVLLAGLGVAAGFLVNSVPTPDRPTAVPPILVEAMKELGRASGAPPYWIGQGPMMLVDVDGDGVKEAVGRGRYVNDGDRVVVAAVRAEDGASVWESDTLGTYSDTYRGPLAFDGERFLFADDVGGVRAMGLDGQTLWTRTLGEAIAGFCAAGVANSKSGGRVLIDMSDGTATPTEQACEPVSHDAGAEWNGWSDHGWSKVRGADLPRTVPDMKARAALALEDDLLLVGHRTPGTRVPTVARWRDGTALWRTELPPASPMTADEGEPALVQVDGDSVFAVVDRRSGTPPVVIRLDAETGDPRWERALPDRLGTWVLTALTIGEGRVFVSSWGAIEVFDRESGALVYRLGSAI